MRHNRGAYSPTNFQVKILPIIVVVSLTFFDLEQISTFYVDKSNKFTYTSPSTKSTIALFVQLLVSVLCSIIERGGGQFLLLRGFYLAFFKGLDDKLISFSTMKLTCGHQYLYAQYFRRCKNIDSNRVITELNMYPIRSQFHHVFVKFFLVCHEVPPL